MALYYPVASGDDATQLAGSGQFMSVAPSSASVDNPIDGYNYAGFRFPSIAIPRGDAIISAKLKFPSLYGSSGSGKFLYGTTLAAEAVANPAQYSGSLKITQRYARTGARVAGSTLPTTSAFWASGADVTAIVQEVVNRGDWASGNAISMIFWGDYDWSGGTPDPNNGYIQPYQIDNSPANKAVLEITTTSGTVNTPVTVTQDTGQTYEGDWTNLNNARVQDGTSATANISSGGQAAKTIRFSNFGFNIPATSNINGIKVEMNKAGFKAFDYGVFLTKGNLDVGYDHSKSTFPSTNAWVMYGNQTDLWGVNWTPTEINNAGFGFSYKVANTSGGGTTSLDGVKVTVFYDIPELGYYNVKQSFFRTGRDADNAGNQAAGTSGNQAVQKQQLWEQITNTQSSTINLSKLKFRLSALYTQYESGGGKGGGEIITYDRTGTPYTVWFFSNATDATNGTNPIQVWTGALGSTNLENYEFRFNTPYAWTPGSTIYIVFRATGVSGVSEPDFMVYAGTSWYSGTDDDPAQITSDMAAFGGGMVTPLQKSMFYEASENAPVVQANSAYPSGGSNITVSGYLVNFGSTALSGGSDISVVGFLMGYGSALAVGDSKAYADRITAIGGSNITVDGVVDPLTITKSYMYKIYDENWNYLGAWNDVVSEFGYSQEINSAGASIDIVLARNSDSLTSNYDVIANDAGSSIITDDGNELAAETATLNAIGPGTTVDLNLNVKIYEFSTLTTDIAGDLVYTGYISRYVSQYGSSEQTKVTVFTYGADLDNYLLTTPEGDTRVSYLSQDPSDILKSSLDRFQADGGLIGYDLGVPGDTEIITNLITNPSFETNTTGWSTTAGSVTRPTSGGNTGSSFLQIQNVSGGRVDYATGNLVSGNTYKFSLYLKRPAGGTATINGTHNSAVVFDLNVSPPATWTRYDIQFNAVANTPLFFSVSITGADNQIHIDSVMLTQGTTLYDYFDGATTDTDPATTFAWTGTANASTSTRTTILNNVGASIEDTNTIVTYAFNINTELEVIKKSLELAPTDWYFYTDLATNMLHFHPRPTTPSHLFYLGKHILNLNLERSMEGITNDLVLTGGKQDKIVTDNFFGANGTLLENHTGELNATWTKHPSGGTGSMVIYNNRVRQVTGGSVVYLVNGSSPSNDYIVSTDIRVITNTGDISIIGRADPTSLNFYMARIMPTNTVELFKCINGTYTLIDSNPFTIVNNTTYKMELVMEGSKIAVRIDGNTLCDVQDSSIVTGYRSGFRTASTTVTDTTGYHFNNFNIKNTGTAGPAIFKRYIDAPSVAQYRRGLARIQDNRVSVESSADIIALSEINRQREPRYRSQITISNGAYEIRDIKLGQLIGFRNFGNYVDKVTMQVVRIDYKPDSVDLQLDTLLPSVPKRLEDIKRNLNQSDVEDNPDAPVLDT